MSSFTANLDTSDAVVSTLRQIIRAIDVQSKRLTKKYGLTGPQLIVLKEFAKTPEATISEISKRVSLSQATVTSILDRLEHQGFASRHRSEIDKRKVYVSLTDKTAAILSSNPSILQEEFTERFDKLEDWEKSLILSVLQRVSSMMNAENILPQPVLDSGPIE